jgi:hypothetical protein
MRMTSTVRRVEKAEAAVNGKVGVRERRERQRRSIAVTMVVDSNLREEQKKHF